MLKDPGVVVIEDGDKIVNVIDCCIWIEESRLGRKNARGYLQFADRWDCGKVFIFKNPRLIVQSGEIFSFCMEPCEDGALIVEITGVKEIQSKPN
jgi:hypothetical protein